MVSKALKKIISLVLVSSLLIGNVFTYVEARDLKLSIIYMLDAIEDMEYKERESVYESEHLSFLSQDEEESNNESSNVEGTTVNESEESENEEEIVNSSEYEEEPEAYTEPEEQASTSENNESENTDSITNEEYKPNDVTFLSDNTVKDEEFTNVATSSDASEEENNSSSEEPEDDTIETESIITSSAEEMSSETATSEETTTVSGTLNVATNSDIVDTEENKNKATQSEIEEVIVTELVEGLAVATESEIFEVRIASLSNAVETTLFGSGLFGAGQELFTYPVSSSTFSLKAVTRKSARGGQTCIGVMVCGLMQTPFGTTDMFSSTICNHQDRHKVEIEVFKEGVTDEDDDTSIYTSECSPGSIAYPDYSAYGTYTENKIYNVQSSLIGVNSTLRYDTFYHVTEKASGCASYTTEEVDLPDDYVGPPVPPIGKHTGSQAYDTMDGHSNGIVKDIADSYFMLYKVKYADNLNKVAAYYNVDESDIAADNHISVNPTNNKFMCYEGDVLFIRYAEPDDRSKPYENDLNPAQLSEFKRLVDVMGYDLAISEFYGEPINMSTGDFYLEHTDFTIAELGDSDFSLSRSYNSMGNILRSDFGYGFNSVVNDRLMVNADGTVMHFAADGGGETYRTNGDNTYSASKGNNILIAVKDESGSSYSDGEYDDEGGELEEGEEDTGYSVGHANYWQLKYEDGTIAIYNGYGTLLNKTDKKGLTTTYNYDSKYRVTSVNLPSGAIIRFTYNSQNLISRVTLPDNTYISYEYDSDRNLIKVTDAENRVIRYEYDSNHRMTAWYDSDNVRQVLNTYDGSGRVIKQIDANGNESTLRYESDRTILTDNEGNEQVFMLDSKKRTTERLFGSNADVSANLVEPEYTKSFNSNSKIATEVDGNGVTTTYTYDGNGNVISEEKSDGTYTISKSFTYDSNNNKTSETDYNGNTTTYTYDARNNLTKITDPNGNTEEMTYDSLSRMTSKKDKKGNVKRWTYSGNNPLPETETNANGGVTRYTYDGMRRKTSEIDAEGYTSTIQYDRTGRKIKEIDKRGNETTYTYSSRGTVTKIKDREDNETTFTYDNVGNILTGTDSENNTFTYEYDRNYNKILEKNLPNEKRMLYNDKGQVIEEIDALNNRKQYTLDGIGNIIKEIDRNGNEINYRYNNVLNKIIEKIDGNGKVTRYNYDYNGNLLKEIKADSSEINYEYDALNQLTKITDEDGTETNFTYDANGNITKKSVGANVYGARTNNVGANVYGARTTEYTYDAVNNLVSEKSPNGHINKCEYDRVGNIVKLIDENNYTIEYTYDGNSNITKIKDAEGHEEEYTYDRENRKKTYTDKNGHITLFNYDRAGRVIEKINALNEKEKLEYDSNDNITKNILYNSDGSIFSEINRTYNALNKLVEERDAENYTTTYTYDNNENITSITNKNGDTKNFTYDASNNVIESTDEMGLTTQYEYDDNYNIIKISDNSFVGASSVSPLVGATQCEPVEIREYDRVGNLIKVVDSINRETNYEYNIFGEQIKKTDKDGAITQYDYDNNGNLTKVVRPDNQELVYTYDKHNKLIKTKLNDVEYEYTYDRNYNITKEKNPLGNVVEWTYDNEGNTTQVKDEEGNTTTNEYDSIGRLVKQTDGNGNDTELKYDRNNNVVEIKTAENITNKFEYDKEGRLTKDIDGENHFVKYEYDGLGNILKKTTESNEVTTYTYDRHNITTSMTDALGNTERYETNLNKQVTKKIQKDGTIYHYNYDRAKRLVNTIDPMNYRINLIYSLGDDVLKTTDTLGREVSYEYDILHNQTKKVDANSNIELYTYDYRGNITKKIDRRETTQNFKYDLTDNLIEYTDANNNKTTYSYDKVGNIKELKQPNGGLIKYDYDANYNRIKVTNPRGKATNYVFDRDNRLVSETDPNGNIKRYDYNRNNSPSKFTSALGNIHKFEYDTDNNLIKEIDPRNKVKQYTYDKLHRLTKTTSELNNTANFTYDVVDNVVGIKDPKGTNTVFDYNAVGKVVQERSVDNTIRTYNYDRAGRLISKINKDQSKVAYDYDANDNLTKKYYLDLSNQQTDDSIIYSYNAENNRLGMNDKSGLSRTLYDKNGNLIVSTSNNDKDIVRYEYDSNDRLTKIVYPTNATVTYTYDENGNIKTVTDKDGLKTTYTYDDNDNEVIRTTGLIETNKRYDADNRLIRIKNEHRFTGELIDEYSYRYDSNNNIIEEIKREPYRKKVSLLDIEKTEENDHTIRVTKQTFTYDAENKLTDARVERLGMKALSEPNVTTYHYEYDANGNRTTVEIKDDGLTLESTVYTYDRLNKLVSSREVTASGLYLYEYTYDDNGNLISEDRHRQFETQRINIRRYEYTKDNKLASVYSGNTLLVSYTYDGDGTITSSLERDLDLNQNLNIHDTNYLNSLTNNQRQLINKVPTNDSFLYELTEYVADKNRPYGETLMERDGIGQLSTIYTYGNQRINTESYNNLSGLYTYDGRGSVSAVIGSYGDFRASYWYDGLGNVKSQIHGYGAFGSGKKYYGYNAESYNPVTGNQNLRNRQLNIRRQRFLTEDIYLGKKNNPLTLNRYIYGNDNPLKFKDPSGFISASNMSGASTSRSSFGCGGGGESTGLVSTGMILTSSMLLYGPGVNSNIQTSFKNSIINGFTSTQLQNELNDDYIKYGFSSAESWNYWNTISTNAVNAEIIKRGITGTINNNQEAIIAGEILGDILYREQRFNSSIIGGLNPPTSNEILVAQAIHYTRNKYNNQIDLPEHVDFKLGTNKIIDSYFESWHEETRAIFHQHTVEGLNGNVKYIDASGHREAIYNRMTGDLVIDARDIGTYNFSSPDDMANHYSLDVLTYYRWGNAPNDPTSWLGRRIGVVD